MTFLGIALFVVLKPTAELFWPWLLTPLTARAIGAWLIGLGIAAGHIGWENDWQRVRAGILSLTVFAGLELIVLVRFAFAQDGAYGPPVVDWGDVQAWAHMIFMVSILAAGAYGWWASRRSLQTEK